MTTSYSTVLGIVLGCAAVVSGCSPDSGRSEVAGQIADEAFGVYFGGTIVTMEPDRPGAEAVVAGDDGRIAFVGDLESAFERYPTARRIDLAGKTMMPGFIEQHLHPFLAALTLAIPVIAPEAWELPDKTWPAVIGQENYIAALTAVERGLLVANGRQARQYQGWQDRELHNS